jgi:hypothetical protein
MSPNRQRNLARTEPPPFENSRRKPKCGAELTAPHCSFLCQPVGVGQLLADCCCVLERQDVVHPVCQGRPHEEHCVDCRVAGDASGKAIAVAKIAIQRSQQSHAQN